MQSRWSIGFGLLSGVVGWMISEFLAKPFRRGIDLVAEARTSILIYANVSARARDFPATSPLLVRPGATFWLRYFDIFPPCSVFTPLSISRHVSNST
jgi:hypothetical protein